MEAISKVRQRNGVSISADCTLVKADFSTGDEVVIRFSGKDFLGVVDLSLDGQSTAQRKATRNRRIPMTFELC